ncbi:hypothetical protein ENUP19_0340G0061 [Entamoeba nuttalli]|uniref:Protein kinase domain containing protein n=2 Tax=Entamoeba nuttalli TaxID=412467 RepID=K2I0G9_ENTNP|nr:protein kinase domain containing protein [Entamoeba nuttalli P19]EKE42245.1 protein kinase domain containing protein [Entamoeba nuttalli P19]|eukprot:XP_008855416.1 protein kinase domain containing protein [Entamoeba nuttalli P19]
MKKGLLVNNRYEITNERVGDGEHSENYISIDLFEGNNVILKKIQSKEEWYNWNNIWRIMKQKPNNKVLQLFDCFQWNHCFFVVSEELCYTLRELLDSDSGYVQHTIPSLIHCFQYTLRYLEELKIIHCDIKPSNIMINNNGVYKLIDYGNALIDYHSSGKEYVQSRWYRAPEVILGCQWTNKIDTWSVGCVLFECIIGDVLFPADNDVDQLMMMRETIGLFPPSLLCQATQNVNNVFTSDGHLIEKYESLIEERNIKELLGSCEYNEVLCLVLELEPENRMTPLEFSSITIKYIDQ